REERIGLGERERFGSLGQRFADGTGEGKADDERAAALEHVASRSVNRHVRLPHAPAARITALTMRAWVPQRHRLLASASLTCASVGFLVLARNAADSMIMPLMQYPHCTACSSMKARCTGCRRSDVPRPSSVTTFCCAVREESGVTHERTALPSTWTVQAPHCASPQPKRGPWSWRLSRSA